jgi:hypothetical protein
MNSESQEVSEGLTHPTSDSSALRLMLHLKENNLQYLVGVLVAYQMGILDSLWAYGAGMC